jgi:hypothetical protein
MDVVTFGDVAPCSPYVIRRLGRTYHLHLQGRKSAEQETSVQQVPLLLRDTSSHVGTTRRYIPEDRNVSQGAKCVAENG